MSDYQFESLLENQELSNFFPDPFFIVDHQSLQFVCVNNRACEVTGYTREELLKSGPHDLDIIYTREILASRFDNVFKQKNKSSVLVTTHRNKDSVTCDVEMHLLGVESSGKHFIIISSRDISEQVTTEKKLRKSEAQLSTLVNNIKDHAIYMVDPDGIVETWNTGAQNIKGYSAEEVIGKSMALFYLQEDTERDVNGLMLRLAKEKGSIEAQGLRIRKDGSIFWANVSLFAIYDKDGSLSGFAKITRDITHQKSLEEKIDRFNKDLEEQVRNKTEELTNIFERITDGFIALDTNWCYTFVNKKAAEIFRLKLPDIIGKPLGSTHPAMMDLPVIKRYREAMINQSYIAEEGYISMMDKWFVNHIYPSPKGLSIFISEITDQKKAQNQLEKSELRYRTLVDQAWDAILITDQYGNYLDVNSSACMLLGYSREEMLTLNARDLIFDQNHIATLPERFDTLRAGTKTIREIRLKRKDGSFIHVESHAGMLSDGTYLGIVRDITERKKIEARLRESEANLNEAQHIAQVGGWHLDFLKNKLSWSDEIYNIFEIDKDQAPSYDLVLQFIHPDDREYLNDSFLNNGNSEVDIVYRIVVKDGSIKYLHGKGKNTYDVNGKLVYSMGTVQDITERKQKEDEIENSQLELRQLAAHLQTVREEERASMAREIHDELGQQLTGLKMDLYWLRNHPTLGEKEREEKIGGTISLIDQTINSVRKIAAELHPSMLEDLGLIEALEWYSEEFQSRSRITIIFRSSIHEIEIDPKIAISMFRIYQESLTNVARHAEAKSVISTVDFSNDEITLTIADDGKGFDLTKVASKKTLGLLSLKERTLMVQGEFKISSELGKGTTVFVKVPVKVKASLL